MIMSKKPLSISEVTGYMKESVGKEALMDYLKKFGKISKEKAEEIRQAILALNNPKIKEDNIIKVIDFLPKDHEEVNKIFLENSLNEEETNSLLNIVKNC